MYPLFHPSIHCAFYHDLFLKWLWTIGIPSFFPFFLKINLILRFVPFHLSTIVFIMSCILLPETKRHMPNWLWIYTIYIFWICNQVRHCQDRLIICIFRMMNIHILPSFTGGKYQCWTFTCFIICMYYFDILIWTFILSYNILMLKCIFSLNALYLCIHDNVY